MGAKPGRHRLDELVVARGLAPSRARAQALIIAGKIFTGTQRLDKPGMAVPEDIALIVQGDDHPYVSRGGLKLVHGLDHFGIDPAGAVAVDIGASTGGFTDVLLKRGAARVFAVDVGRGQFDWALRGDSRVVLLERTNARYVTRAELPEPLDLAVCDASFIGLQQILPASMALVKPGGYLIALIKPQFEVGRGRVGKKGVVRDEALHQEVIDRISAWLADIMHWRVLGVVESPITGPEGNKEFLIGAAAPV